ncbi:MAG: hypothetical protein NC218_12260 [Acetobacter sp.]|nr:hypothetical protein [Acetobacter sp.]
MKKNILKILSFVFVFAFILTGCATVSNIKNDSEKLIYNGGHVALVGNHLYFANAYTPVGDSDTDFAYGNSAKVSYLNRLDLTKDFETELPIESPKGAEKVNSKVVGYENQYMFVLGDYVYFTSANTHKTDKLQNTYKLVTFFRSRLNGDDLSEIFTTNQFDSATGTITTMKGADDKYYLVVFDGNELSTIRLGNSLGKRQVVAKDVLSVAVPGEGEDYSVKEVFYTATHKDEDGNATSEVDIFSVNYATGVKTKRGAAGAGSKVNFIDRVGDTIFYTNSAVVGGGNECYSEDISLTSNFNGGNRFYSSTTLKNVTRVMQGDPLTEGYIFVNGNDSAIMYKNTVSGAETSLLLPKTNYTDILFVEGDYVYYSTTTGIYRISARDKSINTIVEMDSIVSGKCSYVNEYIYFYGQLDLEEEEEVEGETKVEYEEDTNNYMYRIKCDGNGGYQMLSTYTRVEKKSSTN